MDRNRSHHCDPTVETLRVALVYKDFQCRGFSHAGLGVTATSAAKVLRRQGIWATVWPCDDAEDLRERIVRSLEHAKECHEVPISHVIIAAPWVPTPTLAKLATDFPEIVFAVVCHSGVGFLSTDPEAIDNMREAAMLQHDRHNVVGAGNSEHYVDWARIVYQTPGFALLPNLYDLSEYAPGPTKTWNGGLLRIGMFGAARILKNGISGAAAAAQLAVKLGVPTELLVSSGRDEGGSLRPIEAIVKGIPNLTLRRVGWLPWPEFRCLLNQIDVHLQPSHTDSFNNCVADSIFKHKASVVGPAIHWCPDHWKADVDNPGDIARVAEALLRDPNVAADGLRALQGYQQFALPLWLSFFGLAASAGVRAVA